MFIAISNDDDLLAFQEQENVKKSQWSYYDK